MPERKRKTVLALIALPVYFSCWMVCAWSSLDSCDQIKDQLSELAKFHPTSLCCHEKDRPDSESTNTKTDCCSTSFSNFNAVAPSETGDEKILEKLLFCAAPPF